MPAGVGTAAAGVGAEAGAARTAGCLQVALRWTRGRLRDIDASLEIRSVFNDDSAGLDVAHQLRFFLDINLVRGVHVALNGTLNDDLARLQSGLNSGIRPNRQPVLMALNGTFHLTINGEVFAREISDLSRSRSCLARQIRWRLRPVDGALNPTQNFYLTMTSLVFLSSVVQLRARAWKPLALSLACRLAAEGAVRLLFVYSTCKRRLLEFAPFMVLLLHLQGYGSCNIFLFILAVFIRLLHPHPRL